MVKEDITRLIQRDPTQERDAGICLDGLCATLTEGPSGFSAQLYGELCPECGDKLSSEVQVTLAIYDGNNRVIATDQKMFWPQSFFACRVLELHARDLPTQNITSLRLLVSIISRD